MGKLKGLKDALDMSKAARMARAKEQGHLTRGYHGSISGQLPDSFDLKEISFFTPDEEIAERYGRNGAVGSYLLKREKTLKVDGPEDILRLLPEELKIRHADAERSWNVLQDPNLPDLYEDTDVIEYLRDELGFDSIDIGDDLYTDNNGILREHRSYAILKPENIRSSKAAFNPENIGDSDVMGAIDPRLLAPLAAGSGAAVAAQMAYNDEKGDFSKATRAYQDFMQRRQQKKPVWEKLRQGGEALRTVVQGMGAGIVSDAYRLGGYLTPQPVQDTEAQAQTIMNRLAYVPEDQNPIIDEMGRQLDQFGKDVRPLVNAFQQTPIYKAYEMLPERAQGVVNILSDYAF